MINLRDSYTEIKPKKKKEQKYPFKVGSTIKLPYQSIHTVKKINKNIVLYTDGDYDYISFIMDIVKGTDPLTYWMILKIDGKTYGGRRKCK